MTHDADEIIAEDTPILREDSETLLLSTEEYLGKRILHLLDRNETSSTQYGKFGQSVERTRGIHFFTDQQWIGYLPIIAESRGLLILTCRRHQHLPSGIAVSIHPASKE